MNLASHLSRDKLLGGPGGIIPPGGVQGQSPWWGPGAKPLVGSRGKAAGGVQGQSPNQYNFTNIFKIVPTYVEGQDSFLSRFKPEEVTGILRLKAAAWDPVTKKKDSRQELSRLQS